VNLLLLPYVFNIAVLVPVGLTTLLGGPEAQRRLFLGKYPDSVGIRTILGSLWTALLIGSVIYKTLWWLVFVLPRLVCGRSGEIHWGIAGVFIFTVLTYPWVIPWGEMFAR